MCHKRGHYKYSDDHPLDVTRQGVINSWWPLQRRQRGSVTEIPFVPYLRVSLAYGRRMMYSLKCRTLTHAHQRHHTLLQGKVSLVYSLPSVELVLWKTLCSYLAQWSQSLCSTYRGAHWGHSPVVCVVVGWAQEVISEDRWYSSYATAHVIYLYKVAML